MKYLLLILLTASFVASCSDWVPEADKNEREEYEKLQALQKSGCIFSNPDSSVAGIRLWDATSAMRVLGKQIKLTGDSTHLFYSDNKKQVLAITVYAGSYANQVSVFRVSYSPDSKQNYRKMETSDFVTEKGIRLGISKAELTGKLGSCYIVKDSTANTITINYRIAKDLYYAMYQFSNNILTSIAFGYEYP